MGNLPGVSAAFISEIVRREVSSIQWVEELPGLWASVARQWGLEMAGPLRTGATSLVIPVVTRTGLRAGVKLVSPVVTIDAEVSALRAFAGRGAVTLLEAEDARQAMLLEWIDGPALSEMTDMGAAAAIAGRLTRELALAVPPTGAPRLADQAGPWQRNCADSTTPHDGTEPRCLTSTWNRPWESFGTSRRTTPRP